MLKRLLLLVSLTLFAGTLFAAKLKVRIFDDQGNPLGEAAAKLVNEEAKKDWTKKIGKKGEFVFDGLPAGDYVLFIQKQGFLERKMEGIKVETADVNLDVKLVSREFMSKEETAGNEAFAQKDFKTALSHYEQILKIAPNSATTWANMSKAHAMLGDWDQAIEEINKAASMDSTQFADMAKQIKVMNFYQRGEKAMNEKNFVAAEAELNKARELDPANPDVLYMMALCQGHQNKYSEAIKYCEEAIKLRPTDTASLELLKILKNNMEASKKK